MVRLIRFDGADADFMYFSIPSATRPDLRHDMVICKQSGIGSCTCEDASFRKKRWDVLGPEAQDLCRHLRSLRRHAMPYFRAKEII